MFEFVCANGFELRRYLGFGFKGFFFFLADFGELARKGKRGSLIMFVFKT